MSKTTETVSNLVDESIDEVQECMFLMAKVAKTHNFPDMQRIWPLKAATCLQHQPFIQVHSYIYSRINGSDSEDASFVSGAPIAHNRLIPLPSKTFRQPLDSFIARNTSSYGALRWNAKTFRGSSLTQHLNINDLFDFHE